MMYLLDFYTSTACAGCTSKASGQVYSLVAGGFLYCDVALSLQENDWVRLVETTRHLDDYLTLKIHPLIEQDRQDGVTSFNNWNDVVRFIDVITHH